MKLLYMIFMKREKYRKLLSLLVVTICVFFYTYFDLGTLFIDISNKKPLNPYQFYKKNGCIYPFNNRYIHPSKFIFNFILRDRPNKLP